MLSRKREYQSIEATAALWHVESTCQRQIIQQRTDFRFTGSLPTVAEMYADARIVLFRVYQRSPKVVLPLRSPNESGTPGEKWLRFDWSLAPLAMTWSRKLA